jgi:hypothetical protein
VLQVDAGLRQLHVFLDSADPTHTWGGLALADMGADAGSHSSSAVQGSKKSFTAGTAGKGSGTGSADDAVDDLLESVLWVCKDCLMGAKCSSGGAGDSLSGAAKGKGAGRSRQPSRSGGGAASDEVLRLKEGIRMRDIAVRLLVRELKQVGLQVPALPAGVGDAANSSSGSGGRLLARLTGSFGHGSSEAWAAVGGGAGALNDTAKQVVLAGAGGGRMAQGAKISAGPDKGGGQQRQRQSCCWWRWWWWRVRMAEGCCCSSP